MKIQQPPRNNYNFNNRKNINANLSLKGTDTDNVSFNGLKEDTEKRIARILVRIMETKPALKIFAHSEKNQAQKELLNKQAKDFNKKIDIFNKSLPEGARKLKKMKEIPDKLLAHLIVFGSTLLSGFYVLKTLNNKNMEKDKRKTLAINQGLVWGTSTVMAYAFDGWARKQFNTKILNRFKEANKAMDPKKLDSLTKGMEKARTIIIVDMVYRFIAPVIVTPIANAIGNKINNKKQ